MRRSSLRSTPRKGEKEAILTDVSQVSSITLTESAVERLESVAETPVIRKKWGILIEDSFPSNTSITLSKTMAQKLDQTFHAPVMRRSFSLRRHVLPNENESSELVSSPEVRRPFQWKRKLVTRKLDGQAFQAILSESANNTHGSLNLTSTEVSSEEDENSPLPNQALKKRTHKLVDPSVFEAALRNSSQLSRPQSHDMSVQQEASSEFISPEVRPHFRRLQKKSVADDKDTQGFKAILSEGANKTNESSKPASAEVSSEEDENSLLPNQALKKRTQKRVDPSVFGAALRNSSQLSQPHFHDTSVQKEASSENMSPDVQPRFRRLKKNTVTGKFTQAFKAILSESANKTHESSKPASAEVSSEEDKNSPLPIQALKKRTQKRVDPSVFAAALRNSSQLSRLHSHDTSVQQEASSENMFPDVQPRIRRLQKKTTDKDTQAFKAILSESANKTHESSKPASAEVSSEEDKNSPLPIQALKKRTQKRVDPSVFAAALRNSSQLSRLHSHDTSVQQEASSENMFPDVQPRIRRLQKKTTDKDTQAFKAILSESANKTHESSKPASAEVSSEEDKNSPLPIQALKKRTQKRVDPSVFAAALRNSSQLSRLHSHDTSVQQEASSENMSPDVQPRFRRLQKKTVTDKDTQAFKAILSESANKTHESSKPASAEVSSEEDKNSPLPIQALKKRTQKRVDPSVFAAALRNSSQLSRLHSHDTSVQQEASSENMSPDVQPRFRRLQKKTVTDKDTQAFKAILSESANKTHGSLKPASAEVSSEEDENSLLPNQALKKRTQKLVDPSVFEAALRNSSQLSRPRSCDVSVEEASSELASPEARPHFHRKQKQAVTDKDAEAFKALSESQRKVPQSASSGSADLSYKDAGSPEFLQPLQKRRRKDVDPLAFVAAFQDSSQVSHSGSADLSYKDAGSPEFVQPFQKRRRKDVYPSVFVTALQNSSQLSMEGSGAGASDNRLQKNSLSKNSDPEIDLMNKQPFNKRGEKQSDPTAFMSAQRDLSGSRASNATSGSQRLTILQTLHYEPRVSLQNISTSNKSHHQDNLSGSREEEFKGFEPTNKSLHLSSQENKSSDKVNKSLMKLRDDQNNASAHISAQRHSSISTIYDAPSGDELVMSRLQKHTSSEKVNSKTDKSFSNAVAGSTNLPEKDVAGAAISQTYRRDAHSSALAIEAAHSDSESSDIGASIPKDARTSSGIQSTSQGSPKVKKTPTKVRGSTSGIQVVVRKSPRKEMSAKDVEPSSPKKNNPETSTKHASSTSGMQTHLQKSPGKKTPKKTHPIKDARTSETQSPLQGSAMKNTTNPSTPIKDADSMSGMQTHLRRSPRKKISNKSHPIEDTRLSKIQSPLQESPNKNASNPETPMKEAGLTTGMEIPLRRSLRNKISDIKDTRLSSEIQIPLRGHPKESTNQTIPNKDPRSSLGMQSHLLRSSRKETSNKVGKILSPAVALLQNLTPGKEENSPVLSQGIRKRRLAHADGSTWKNILGGYIQPSQINTNTTYSQEAAKLPTPVTKVQTPKRHINKKMELQDQVANEVSSRDSSIVPATMGSTQNSSEEHLPFLRPKRPMLEPKSFEEDFENASFFSSSTKDLEPFPKRYLHRDRSFTPSDERHLRTMINQIHALGGENRGDNLNNSIPRSESQRQNVKATMKQKSVVSRNSHISHNTMRAAEGSMRNAGGDHDVAGDRSSDDVGGNISQRSKLQRYDVKAITKQKSVVNRNSQISHSTMTAEGNRSNAGGDHDDQGDISRRSKSQIHNAKAVTKQKSVMRRMSEISHSTAAEGNRSNAGDDHGDISRRSVSQKHDAKAVTEQKSVMSRNSQISHSTMTAEGNRSNAGGDHDDHGDISRRSKSQRHNAKAVTKQKSVMRRMSEISHSTTAEGNRSNDDISKSSISQRHYAKAVMERKSVMNRNSQISHSTMTAEGNRSNADGDHDDHGDISRRSKSQRHNAKAVTKQKSGMRRMSEISHSTTAEGNRSNAGGDHDDHGDISRRSVSQRHDAKAVTEQKSVMSRNSQISHSTMTAEGNRSNAGDDHDDHGDISRRSKSQRHNAKAVIKQKSVMRRMSEISHSTTAEGNRSNVSGDAGKRNDDVAGNISQRQFIKAIMKQKSLMTKNMRISDSTKKAVGGLKQLTIPSLFPKQITLAPRGTEERRLQMREFVKKVKQAEDEERRILRIQEEEEEEKRRRTEAPKVIVKKVVITKRPTVKRPVNRIQAITGKRSARLKKPQYWATPRLYKLIIKHCEEKFGEIEAYRRAEEFVIWLCKQVQIVIRRKKLDKYRNIAENVKRGLYKLGVIKSLMDYFLFIENYLPFLYRIKVIPCSRAYDQVTGIPIPPGTDLFADLGL